MPPETAMLDDRPQAPEPARRRMLLRWRFAWAVLCLLVLLGVGLLLGYLLRESQARRLLQAEIDKKAGEPLTTAELANYHALPAGTRDYSQAWLEVLRSFDDQNYQEMEIFMPITGLNIRLPPLADAIAAEDQRAIDCYLALNRPKLDALYTLAPHYDEIRYPRDFRTAIADWKMSSQLRDAHKLLSLEFQVLARQEKASGAIRNLAVRIALADSLKHELDAVQMLTRVAIVGVALADLRDLANARSLDDGELAESQSLLASISFHPQLADVMLDERSRSYKAFHHPLNLRSREESLFRPIESGRNAYAISRPRDCAKALSLGNRLCAAAVLPLPEAIPVFEQIDAEIEALVADDRLWSKWDYHATRQIFAAFNASLQVARAAARGEAEVALMQAALGVRRYLLKHHQPPAQLKELFPDCLEPVTIDPMDGQRLRYRVETDKVVIYSIGVDRVDNQGQTDSRNAYALDLAEVLPLSK